MKAHTQATQAAMTNASSLQALMDGNARFLAKTPVNRDLLDQINDTTNGQYPFACVLSCIDSRIPTEIIFDQGIGDIFNARVAGNFVNDDILGSMEFACKLAKARVIMVMGHTSCGGVKGACDNAKIGLLTGMLAKIKPAVAAIATEPGEDRSSKNKAFVDRVAVENVRMNVKDVTERSEVLATMVADGDVIVVGAMYDVSSGKVTMVD
jgi:carbonic anhydrase